jgi:hypothetical protein
MVAKYYPGVHRSNRAYVAFLNQLRADTFESMIKNAKVFGVDGATNVPQARSIANFINLATGRGSLGQLEQAGKLLNYGLFAPRLIASRLQILNPHYYWAADKFVRKEALKSLFAMFAVGNTILQLGEMAGGEVSNDPSNSDFRKLKIGDTRIDPWGGYQQYFTALNRLFNPLSPATSRDLQEWDIPGADEMGEVPEPGVLNPPSLTRGQMVTSSTTPTNEYDLWAEDQGPYDPTWAGVAGRVLRGKVHPVIGFAWSLFGGRKELSGEQMKFGLNFDDPASTYHSVMENSIAQRAIPIFLQDMYELSINDELPPELKPLLATLSWFGMGQQTYGPKVEQ